MFRTLVLCCAVLALVNGQTTQVNQCLGSSAGPQPINAYIHGCTTQPCQLPQGQDAIVEIVFRAPYVIHQMTTVAIAYLGIIPINYDLGPMAQTCGYLINTYCPVVQGEVIQYRLNMAIEDFMVAGTQLPIEFRILDDSNRAIVCIRVQVRVVPPINKFGAQNATMTIEA